MQSFTAQQKESFDHLSDIPIETYFNVTPRIMIGLERWRFGIPMEIKEGIESVPIAATTRLGWIIHGSCCLHAEHTVSQIHQSYHIYACNSNNILLNNSAIDKLTKDDVSTLATLSYKKKIATSSDGSFLRSVGVLRFFFVFKYIG